MKNYFLSIHDANGNFLNVSDDITRIVGWSKEDVIGKSAYYFFNAGYLNKIIVSHLNKNTDMVTYKYNKKDGGTTYLETISFKEVDNNIYCLNRKLNSFEIFLHKISQLFK